ncbi:dual 3',5'-cyclic-AMP and -GMP phosphodiesterase 11 isoform X3 [Ixodes scapularis]|nr:dual 3',5'-cyclic-AMP and -GMP phosphodiesterase 11 isoform X3 [Ixodes scapularis]
MTAAAGNQDGGELDEARIEAWLDEHPAFVGDYFMRKASRKVVDSWLLAHAVPQSVVQDQGHNTAVVRCNSGGSASLNGSGVSPPMRKISACEFDRGNPLRPIVQTSFDGTPTFLALPAGGEAQRKSDCRRMFLQNASAPRQQRRSRQELRALNERELIFELVKDICNELDIRMLCHKILQNVTVITNADRCSLFLVHGDRDSTERCLVSQLFDVSCQSTLEQVRYEEVRVPWGSGIVGYVAQSKEAVNIPDCYNDSRFNKSIDLRTGYRTRCMLCMPVFDRDGEVIGVAQVINKKDHNGHDVFNRNDEKVFSEYLQFCGLVLRNAQLYERSELENTRNQVLLDLARMVFEEQSTIEQVVYRIMVHMQALLECERCQVLLVDHKTKTTFHRVFDLEAKDVLKDDMSCCTSPYEGRFPINTGITGCVVATGQIANIPDAYKDERFDSKVDEGGVFKHKSILCIPIYNAGRLVLGVAQLINKLNGEPFNKNDEQLLEAFAIFCGLGIQNTQMYEKVVKAMAKQRVTLEVLSYHATAPLDEARKLSECMLPSTQSLKLQDFKFNDFSLDDDGMLTACLRIFLELDFLNRFHIEYTVLCRWLLSVKKNYRGVSYHNWRHAFNVGQMMFAILTNTKLHEVLGDLETFGLIVACFCHDLDHRGTNNSFQIKSSSPLAQLYSTSTMEHHHFDQCIMILNSQGNQILSHVSPAEYTTIIRVVEESILATDLAVYFRKRGLFFKLVENKEYQWNNGDHRELLRNMLMTACDIGAITKPWEVQRVVADLVTMEFFQQGDMERQELKIQPIDMMNRDKQDQLPAMQLGFIDSICLPLYRAFSRIHERLGALLEGVEHNRHEWQRLAEARLAAVNGDQNGPGDGEADKRRAGPVAVL